MNIDPVQDYNISMHGYKWNVFKRSAKQTAKKAAQFIIDLTPSHTAKSSEKLNETRAKINDIISRPMENRFINGLLALLTIPPIDYNNHKLDDETREVAVCRTIAKILAGTAVGMAVRGPVYRFIEKTTNVEGKSKFSQFLLPKRYISEMKGNKTFLKNYRSALAMFIAMIVMAYTNFKCDAPLTTYLTNKFNNKRMKLKGINVQNSQDNSNLNAIAENNEINKSGPEIKEVAYV